jgi:hypothetical protein
MRYLILIIYYFIVLETCDLPDGWLIYLTIIFIYAFYNFFIYLKRLIKCLEQFYSHYQHHH